MRSNTGDHFIYCPKTEHLRIVSFTGISNHRNVNEETWQKPKHCNRFIMPMIKRY